LKRPFYQVDAFASRPFTGNPAAICPLETWLDDATMQAVAAENNLSETAFFVKAADCLELRWFTPTTEVDLCGHATLASAFVVLELLEPGRERVRFSTRSGILEVERGPHGSGLLTMDFPALPATPVEPPPALLDGLRDAPREVLQATNYLAVFESEETVRRLAPDFESLARCYPLGIIATAPSEHYDFVSRFFAPAHGIPEDPATGSAHCTLAPYWSRRLGKTELHGFQASKRGAEIFCRTTPERIAISGRCVLYAEGSYRTG
jgi:predicted PhzF superfamily epimerase YddE/YHI9